MFDKEWTFITVICYALFASLGGSLSYIMRSLDNKSKISFSRLLFQAVTAAFFGIIILLVCYELKFSLAWTGVVVGVTSWLGADITISIIEQVIHKRFGIRLKKGVPHNDDNDSQHS